MNKTTTNKGWVDLVTIQVECKQCREMCSLTVNKTALERFQGGLSFEEKALLLTHTCGLCVDSMLETVEVDRELEEVLI